MITLHDIISGCGVVGIAILVALGVGFLIALVFGRPALSDDFPWHDDRA